MSRITFALLVVVGIVLGTVAAQNQQCGPNEEYTTCGSACPPSCNSRPNQPCTLQCVIGCQCKPDYLRSANGQCVTPQNC